MLTDICLCDGRGQVGNPPGGTGESKSFENVHSWRAHFGAWLINSSPLILSFGAGAALYLSLSPPPPPVSLCLSPSPRSAGPPGTSVLNRCAPPPARLRSPHLADLTDLRKLDLVWDFITNREALKINSDWAGEAGRLVSSVYVGGPFASWNRSILTEIYLCHASSYHEIEDGNGAPGPDRPDPRVRTPVLTHSGHAEVRAHGIRSAEVSGCQ
jgi:hypothetical protein